LFLYFLHNVNIIAAFWEKSGANPALSRNCENLTVQARSPEAASTARLRGQAFVGKNICPTSPLFTLTGAFFILFHRCTA